MDLRPVGVFDSGFGGLSAVRELRRALPNEDIIYFGDTGRVPYGGRSVSTIIKYAKQDIRFLESFDIKAILIACGTVSSALHRFSDEIALPVTGVVEPTVASAKSSTKNGKIGIIGTAATIASGAYERALGDGFEVMSVACPLFVPLVENGRFEPGDVVIETVAREYLAPFAGFGCDTLILGCTHYPLLKRVIAGVLPGVTLIDSGAEAALALKSMLSAGGLSSGRENGGAVDYHVSDDPENFSRLASIFMGEPVEACAKKVDIEKY